MKIYTYLFLFLMMPFLAFADTPSLYEQVMAAYPSIPPSSFSNGTIILQNDGCGDYVKAWHYSQPLPKGLPTLSPTCVANASTQKR